MELFIYFDGSQGVPQVFNSSIVNIFIPLRLVGLVMLSIGLPFAISNVRATYFTAKIPGSLQFLGHDIVNVGLPKYYLVQYKPVKGVSFLQWARGDSWDTGRPHSVPLSGQHFQRWLAWSLVEGGPERDFAVLFGLCDMGRGVPQVFNPFILLVWTQHKVMSLRILFTGQTLALSYQNLSVPRPQMAISEELLIACNS